MLDILVYKESLALRETWYESTKVVKELKLHSYLPYRLSNEYHHIRMLVTVASLRFLECELSSEVFTISPTHRYPIRGLGPTQPNGSASSPCLTGRYRLSICCLFLIRLSGKTSRDPDRSMTSLGPWVTRTSLVGYILGRGTVGLVQPLGGATNGPTLQPTGSTSTTDPPACMLSAQL